MRTQVCFKYVSFSSSNGTHFRNLQRKSTFILASSTGVKLTLKQKFPVLWMLRQDNSEGYLKNYLQEKGCKISPYTLLIAYKSKQLETFGAPKHHSKDTFRYLPVYLSSSHSQERKVPCKDNFRSRTELKPIIMNPYVCTIAPKSNLATYEWNDPWIAPWLRCLD